MTLIHVAKHCSTVPKEESVKVLTKAYKERERLQELIDGYENDATSLKASEMLNDNRFDPI